MAVEDTKPSPKFLRGCHQVSQKCLARFLWKPCLLHGYGFRTATAVEMQKIDLDPSPLAVRREGQQTPLPWGIDRNKTDIGGWNPKPSTLGRQERGWDICSSWISAGDREEWLETLSL